MLRVCLGREDWRVRPTLTAPRSSLTRSRAGPQQRHADTARDLRENEDPSRPWRRLLGPGRPEGRAPRVSLTVPPSRGRPTGQRAGLRWGASCVGSGPWAGWGAPRQRPPVVTPRGLARAGGAAPPPAGCYGARSPGLFRRRSGSAVRCAASSSVGTWTRPARGLGSPVPAVEAVRGTGSSASFFLRLPKWAPHPHRPARPRARTAVHSRRLGGLGPAALGGDSWPSSGGTRAADSPVPGARPLPALTRPPAPRALPQTRAASRSRAHGLAPVPTRPRPPAALTRPRLTHVPTRPRPHALPQTRSRTLLPERSPETPTPARSPAASSSRGWSRAREARGRPRRIQSDSLRSRARAAGVAWSPQGNRLDPGSARTSG